jgi:hypothetical protein
MAAVRSVVLGLLAQRCLGSEAWRDVSMSPAERASALLAEMTLEEKVAM